MCGIMGYIGDENATDIIISGLEELEYRGYDSAGLAVCDGKEIKTVKVVGSPSGLREEADGIKGKIGIGHTRWATHGAPTVVNSTAAMSWKTSLSKRALDSKATPTLRLLLKCSNISITAISREPSVQLFHASRVHMPLR